MAAPHQSTGNVVPNTCTFTSVAASTSSVTLLAANAGRLGACFFNDTVASVLFIKLGATASSSSYTTKVAAGAYYEAPLGYVGIIDGIWDVASGNVRITELS